MIGSTKLDGFGKNTRNGQHIVEYAFLEKMTGYYLGDGEDVAMMRWRGQGAVSLGLHDKEVTKEDMLKLCDGFAPDGTALCKNAGQKPREVIKKNRKGEERTVLEGGHRVGFDITVSSSKPMDCAFALADAEERLRILEVHRKANEEAMRFLEKSVETRRGAQGKEVIGLNGLIYSSHDHLTSRENEPNLHTHNIVYGVAEGEDGKWGTFDAKELYRLRYAADMIYQARCAEGMKELGYCIEQKETFKKGEKVKSWSIQGLPDELVKAWSSRREDILEYQKEFQVDAQTATMATRKKKEEPSLEELDKMWRETASQIAPHLVEDFQKLKDPTRVARQLEETPTQELLIKLHKTEAIVCEHDIIQLLGNEYQGLLAPEKLLEKVEKFKEHLVEVRPKELHQDDRSELAPDKVANEYKEKRYQAKWLSEAESEIAYITTLRQYEDKLKLPANRVEEAIATYQEEKGFTLSDEQAQAIKHLTHETGGVALLEGFAGTGKTTVADVYKRAFEQEGFTMIGCAISNAAAKKLHEESGMECYSVSATVSMIERGELKLDRKTVVVLDEAGMIGTTHTRKLMHATREAGAKFILQGDEFQLQPVDAGSGFGLVKEVQGTAKLTEIRRQAKDEDKAIAKLFYDEFHEGLGEGVKSRAQVLEKGHVIFDALEARGALQDYNTLEDAAKKLVEDYMQHPAPAEDKIILAHTKADIALVNEHLRSALKDEGTVAKEDVSLRVFHDKEFVQKGFAEGDRIRFLAKDKGLGVINGTEGMLKSITPDQWGGHDLVVKTDDAELHFSTWECAAFDHNYALTVHKAQGQGKAEVFHLLNKGMQDNQSGLVAFTRLTKGDYTLYGTNDDIEDLKGRLGLDRRKENALKIEKSQPQVMRESQEQKKGKERGIQTPGHVERKQVRQL